MGKTVFRPPIVMLAQLSKHSVVASSTRAVVGRKICHIERSSTPSNYATHTHSHVKIDLVSNMPIAGLRSLSPYILDIL